jgi:hypothetical protein
MQKANASTFETLTNLLSLPKFIEKRLEVKHIIPDDPELYSAVFERDSLHVRLIMLVFLELFDTKILV